MKKLLYNLKLVYVLPVVYVIYFLSSAFFLSDYGFFEEIFKFKYAFSVPGAIILMNLIAVEWSSLFIPLSNVMLYALLGYLLDKVSRYWLVPTIFIILFLGIYIGNPSYYPASSNWISLFSSNEWKCSCFGKETAHMNRTKFGSKVCFGVKYQCR